MGARNMLLELTIHNFALIEEIRLELGSGLNILTGETGAGKSIIIDAVNLVLGGRASSEFIRDPDKKAVVEGVFQISRIEKFFQILEELGVEIEEDAILVMTREISAGSGRNLCRINGRIVNLNNYRQVGQLLVDIHGQHEQQSLLQTDRYLELLDSYGGVEISELKSQIANLYNELHKTTKEVNDWVKNESVLIQRQELLAYQVSEIEAAHLVEGEDNELQQEKVILQNAERLFKGVNEVCQLIHNGSNQQSAAYDQIGKAVDELTTLSTLDPALVPVKENLETTLYQIEDTVRELRQYLEGIIPDPVRLEQVEERLALLQKLKRKYGNTIRDILNFKKNATVELENFQRGTEKLNKLEQRRKKLEKEYQELAHKLSYQRKQVAAILEEGIKKELKLLGLPQVQFKIDFIWRDEPAPEGQDEVEFLLSTNPGEVLKPLARIASGGELSRIMLALKTLLASVDQIPTLIFDEIDTGIGGKPLEAVAARLAKVARYHQVICVTHAAQIASWADNHFYLEKQVVAGRTHINIYLLTPEKRITEISRMLSGNSESNVSRQHAIELLDRAQEQKLCFSRE